MRALVPLEQPEAVLRWATAAFPRLVLVSSLGPQTLVVLELLHRLGRAVPVVLLDTGLLFPETLALKETLEARYGLEITSVRPAQTVAQQAAAHGDALWARDPAACCRLRKVAPLAEALRGQDAWITGLRRDQSASRSAVGPADWDAQHGLVKVSPLWRWSQADALDFLRRAGVPYNPLLDRGYRSVGCWPCTAPTSGGERDGRWPGQARSECGIHGGPVAGRAVAPAGRPTLSVLPGLAPSGPAPREVGAAGASAARASTPRLILAPAPALGPPAPAGSVNPADLPVAVAVPTPSGAARPVHPEDPS